MGATADSHRVARERSVAAARSEVTEEAKAVVAEGMEKRWAGTEALAMEVAVAT